jgi:hypothetical protein
MFDRLLLDEQQRETMQEKARLCRVFALDGPEQAVAGVQLVIAR